MILVCHLILQDHVIKGSHYFMGWSPHGKSHHFMIGGHRDCGSGYMMFVVVKEQDPACPRLNRSLLFISKAYGMSW